MAQNAEQESSLKAVFIYNFTKYIEWDKKIEGDFVIGVLGESPVTKVLAQIAKTSTAKNKNIVVKQFNRPEDISACNILFISKNLPYSLQSILAWVDKGVLTISEEPGYASKGTMFNFVIMNNKLKFEANLKNIYSAGLKASSQLLKLAVIVD